MKRLIQSSASTAALLTLGVLSVACSDRAADSATDTPNVNSPSVEQMADAVTRSSGAFAGPNDHVVTGRASLVEDGGKLYLMLDEAFTLDGAPDPKVGFGQDGAYNPSTTLAALQQDKGAQVYEIPASLDLGDVNEAYIWCEDFSVALGVATLTP